MSLTHREKLALVAQWLRDEGWNDYAIAKRAQKEFAIRDLYRARELVDKAARRMRGEVVPMAGRPVQVTAITRNGHRLEYKIVEVRVVNDNVTATASNGHTLQWSSGQWHVDGKAFATRKEAMAILNRLKKEKE